MSELIADKAFYINNTKEYILSIQVSLDGFYFSVVYNNRLLILEEYPVKISSDKFLGRRFNEWLSCTDLFEKSWAEVRIVYLTSKITLVPGEFYNYEKQDEIINLIFDKQTGYITRDNYWPENRCNLIFPVHEDFLKTAGQKFLGNQIIHPATVLNQKIQPYLEDNKTTLSLFFENSHFYQILYCNKELKSVNCYFYNNAEDVLFYVLSVLSSYNIIYSAADLILAGKIELSDEIYKKLNHYTENLSIIKNQINYDPAVFTKPMQRFITLI
jgi:hypothetical protein